MDIEQFEDYKSKLELGLAEHPDLDVSVLAAVAAAVKSKKDRIRNLPFELSVPFPAYRERLEGLVTQIGLTCVGMYHMPSHRWKLALEEKPADKRSQTRPLVTNIA